MNTKSIAFLVLLSGSFLVCAHAIANEPEPQASASAENFAPQPPAAERTIYSSQLPSVDQLTQTARAQGLTIATINQAASEITVVYRLADNSTRTISYQLLPGAMESGVVAPAPVSSATVIGAGEAPPVEVVQVVPAPRTVVYRYYEPYDPFYSYPSYWRPRVPVSINLGFGWGGYYGGHHRFYGGHRHYRHGGRRHW